MLVGREGGEMVSRPLVKACGELPMLSSLKKGQCKKL